MLLSIKNLSVSIENKRILNNLSLEINEGEVHAIMGPNGSGKTTLFNSIVGYHPIDSGTIHFDNREISQLKVQKIARLGVLRTFQQTRI